MNITIRRFEEDDATTVSDIVAYTLRTVNIKDYPEKYIEKTIKSHNKDVILDRAKWSHMYVACDDKKVIGCGSIAPYWGSKTESIFLTIFLLPEYHSKGIGKSIIQTLEADEFFKRAQRIEIPASITACDFYRKMGYTYKNNVTIPDKEGCIRLEKYNI